MKIFLDGVFALGLGGSLGSSDYLYTIRREISKKGFTNWKSETVFLPTEVEVFGISTCGDDQCGSNTNIQFPIFRESAFYRIKKYNGSRWSWWEGSSSATDDHRFCSAGNTGDSIKYAADESLVGVAPAFCTC